MPQTAPQPIEQRTFYGLRDSETGALFRVRSPNAYRDGYELTLEGDEPFFEAESVDALQWVLLESVPSYISSAERPSWGPFPRARLQPVQASLSITAQPLAVPPCLRLRSIDTRDIPRKVAEQYAGKVALAELPVDTRFIFWLVALEEGQDLAQLQAAEGDFAYASTSARRRIYKALEVPAEYAPLLENQAGALVIASTLS